MSNVSFSQLLQWIGNQREIWKKGFFYLSDLMFSHTTEEKETYCTYHSFHKQIFYLNKYILRNCCFLFLILKKHQMSLYFKAENCCLAIYLLTILLFICIKMWLQHKQSSSPSLIGFFWVLWSCILFCCLFSVRVIHFPWTSPWSPQTRKQCIKCLFGSI